MLENIRGHSRGSIPPLRMPSPLPHDLCHEWNVSRRLPAVDGRKGGSFKILNLVARENASIFNTERRAGLGEAG